MKLYKYRSLDNLEYILDILLNERLHCAPYESLNDPFEGVFFSVIQMGGFFNSQPLNVASVGGGGIVKSPQTISASASTISGGTRVCSLSASLSDIRLWSLYANGHSGIAIEIYFDDSEDNLYKIEYVDQLSEISQGLLANPKTTEILRRKTKHWDYEKEYRIISEEEFHPIPGMVVGVYLGHRAPEHLISMLLRLIPDSVPIYTTRLNEASIEVEIREQLNKAALR